MLINELAKKTGLSTHTIRFYEKLGLIKGKRAEKGSTNNYHNYDEEVAEKLELIRDAKSVGFTLKEITELMDAWYSKRMSIAQKVKVLDDKLTAIDEKIVELKEMKKVLNVFKKDVLAGEC
jgi:MerR family transcriptional regulator, copper efflux regulator